MNFHNIGPTAQEQTSSPAVGDDAAQLECPRIGHIVLQLKAAILAARQGLQADINVPASMTFRVSYNEKGVQLYAEGDYLDQFPYFKSCFEDHGLLFSALGEHGVYVHGSKATNVHIH